MSMTREEAIKFAHHAYDMTDIPDVKEFYAIAENALREQEQHRWIPVAERLPKPFESVLALIPSEAPLPTVHESYIADNDEWVCILTVERYKPGEVTHWMPMPEMMKEV